MASLEASLKLRDKFTSVLKTIDSGLQKTTKTMDDFKSKAAGPAQALNKMTAAARASVDKMNSSIKSGMDKMQNIVKSSNQRILSLFGNFGNGISKAFNQITGRGKKIAALDEIDKQLTKLKNKEAKIKINVDKMPQVTKQITDVDRRLARLNNAKADIKANVTNVDVANKRLESLDKHIQRLNNQKTMLNVEVGKIDKAKSHLSDVQKEIDSLNQKRIELNTSAFSANFSRFTSYMTSKIDSMKSKVSAGFSAVSNSVRNGTNKIGGFLKQSGNAFKQYGDDMKNAFDKMKTSASSAGGGFKSMVAAIGVTKAIGMGVNALTNGIKSMVGELSAAGATWQVFEGNMSMLGKSGKEIGSVKKELQQFAQETIYSASDMASTYSQLAAVGVKNTTQLVKGFGGLAAASEDPAQAMKTLSQQATQMAAKPAVQWADFKLMLEQTPAGIAAIAKTMGMTTSQLVSNVQEGTIKTQDLFNAITQTGTNKAFTKMATEFKTVGQAMDGLTEGLTNKLQPTFDKISAFGIKKVSQLADYVDTIDFDKVIGDMVAKVKPYLEVFKQSFNDVKQPVMDAVNAIRESLGGLKGEKSNLDSFKSFMESVVDTITKLAKFAEKHSDSIAKLIKMLPKLAAAFVGFKIGKGVLSPLLNFGSGLFGMTKATGKLAGGLGKAFAGLFNKIPKKGPELPGMGTDSKGSAGALNPFSGFLNTMKGFAKGAASLAIVFVVIKLIQEAAQALKDVNDKVPKDLSVLGPKLFNMGLALVGMGAFVKSIGKFAEKSPKAAIAGLVGVAAISANLMLAAEAMQQINDKVSGDIGQLASKMTNMAIAIGGMAVLVGAVGLLTQLNPVAAIAGLAMIAGISLELMLAAEAMQQVNDKVPSNIGDFASKVANIGIAIGGMTVLATIVGGVMASGIGALLIGGGLATIAAVALELMLVSEAIQQMDQKVPSDLSSVKAKIDNIAQVIQHFTDANLGSVLDVFSNLAGVINTGVVISGINKFQELSTELNALSAVTLNAEKIKGNITKIQEVVDHLSDGGGGLFNKLKGLLDGALDGSVFESAKQSVSKLVDIGASLNELQLTSFNASFVKKKITDINEVITNLGSSGIGSVIGAMVKSSQLNKVNEALTALLALFGPINEMSNTPLLTGSANSKIRFIEELIGNIGSASIGDVIGTMVKSAEIEKVKSTFESLYELYEPINNLSNNAVFTGSAKVKIGYINELIAELGKSGLSDVIGTMLKTSELNRVKSTLDSVFNLFAPINLLSNTPLLTGSANSKIRFIQELLETLGTGTFGAIISQMLKATELEKVKATIDNLFALYTPINNLSNTPLSTAPAKTKIDLIRVLAESLNQSSFGVVLSGMVTAEALTTATTVLSNVNTLANAINQLAGLEINVADALNMLTNIKTVIRQLNNFPEIVGVGGLQALVDTFNQLAVGLRLFINTSEISIAGLQSVSSSFNSSMASIKTSVSGAMIAIVASGQKGMIDFNTTIMQGVNTSVTIAKAGNIQIVAAFNGMQPQLYNAGLMSMSGLTNGINAGAGSAILAAQRVANQVASTVRRALDIHSPSRIMDSIGRFVPAGLARGIERATHLVRSASESLALATIPTDLANVSASGNITSNVMLDDSEIARLKASTKQEIVVNQKQVTPQVTIYVDNKNGEPIDEEALLEKFEAKIVELYDSDLN